MTQRTTETATELGLGIRRTDDVNELLQRGSCTMAFQPILELSSVKTYGFEALLRGTNGTLVPRPEFFFAGEERLDEELLLRRDIACIGSALREGKELAKEHRLFINVHAVSLRHLSLNLGPFLGLLDELDIAPRNIVFEISERTDLSHAKNIEEDLRGLVKLGVQVAIDDIGGSFNWLHHMLHTKPSYLKVDRAHIDSIDASTRKQALLRSLHLMCHAMGLGLIAEGIETPGQLSMLKMIGIAFAQGFWLGRPEKACEWIRK